MSTSRPVIVLDPGHGGHSPAGGSTPDNVMGPGVSERQLTLDLARRVRDQLGATATVMLTRDSDTNLSLQSRANFAQLVNADYFVSLHFNAHDDPTHDSTEAFVPLDATPADEEFARALQQSVSTTLGTTGGVFKADLGVLRRTRHLDRTRVALLESCDLSNPGRGGSATTPDFIHGLASAISSAVLQRASAEVNGAVPAASAAGFHGARALDIESDIAAVLDYIRTEARTRAAVPRSFADTDRFMQILRTRYLPGYLATPSPETGQAAIASISQQNVSGLATEVCGEPDPWEAMTPGFNHVSVPGLSSVPGLGGLLDDLGSATEIITVANRRELDHIDGPFLLGRHTIDLFDCNFRQKATVDPDLLADNEINESQLMHWATGVKYHDWSEEHIRDLFLAYELWHLELWDVFGRDPINDLIAEDAGWHLAQQLKSGAITEANLTAEVSTLFANGRAWVGALLAERKDALEAQIVADAPPDASIHWGAFTITPDEPHHPYPNPSIRRMLAAGTSLDDVKASRLVDDYIAVYTLIVEAETNVQATDHTQRMMAAGWFDWAFKRFTGEGTSSSLGMIVAPTRTVARAQSDEITGPLTDDEWTLVEMWQSRNEVGIDPLTADADANASLVAGAVFCGRQLFTGSSNDDPLLCIDNAVTTADARVQALKTQVTARGPIINWSTVGNAERMRYAVQRLVDQYGYPANGASGLVGNLQAESGVLPPRLEGSAAATPMRSRDFAGQLVDWDGPAVRDRDFSAKTGPRLPGVGLAQWTSASRRTALFTHAFGTRPAGTGILFDMDAQIDYLVHELRSSFAGVEAVLMSPAVTLDDASDEVVYNFEVPGAILSNGAKLPRADAAVQSVFAGRRATGLQALNSYTSSAPSGN